MTKEFTNKSIKNVPFSGKRADYEKWAKRFLSYAQMKKVKQILLGKEKPPSTTEILEMQVKSDLSLDSKGKNDVKNDTDLLKLKAANDLAHNMLMLAVDDPISFEVLALLALMIYLMEMLL